MNDTGVAARPPLAERLKQNADGVLEQIAREYAVSTFDVVQALPAEHRGRPSRALQFNRAGEAMFKVFVRRDKERNPIGAQVARFDALRVRLAGNG